MEVKQLRFDGGLNLDATFDSLPEGDYLDAQNIVIDASSSIGDGNAVKQIEGLSSVASLGVPGGVSSGTIKAAVTDKNNNVYYLIADATYASIGKLSTANLRTTILTRYNHGSCSIEHPDLKILGNVLVWNYYAGGVPLSWFIGRTPATDPALEDITLIKEPPQYPPVFTLNTSSSPVETFKERSFQFAYRYKYDSGEVSALSPFSQILMATEVNSIDTGINGISSVTVARSGSISLPTYYNQVEWFARKGEDGSWFRIQTNTGGSFTFSGHLFEALDTPEAAKLFDTVPIESSNIEVADNRIWLANNKDNFDTNSFNSVSLSIAGGNGQTTGVGSAGAGYSYLDKTINTHTKQNQNRTFANNSAYQVGILFYDEFMRTRGVESSTTFNSGDFSYPLIPTLNITRNTAIPSWAKHYQLAVSNNLTKDYFYEGYVTSLYYVKDKANSEDETYESLEPDDSARDKIKYVVIDLAGMFEAGYVYKFSEGDRIRGIFNRKHTTQIQEAAVLGQTGSQILVDPTGLDLDDSKTMLAEFVFPSYASPAFTTPPHWSIEIFSPTNNQDNTVYYEQGTVYPISNLTALGIGASTSLVLEGDSFMHRASIPMYDASPRLENAIVFMARDSAITPNQDVFFTLISSNPEIERCISLDEGLRGAMVGVSGSYYLRMDYAVPSGTSISIQVKEKDPSDGSETILHESLTINNPTPNAIYSFNVILELTAGKRLILDRVGTSGYLNDTTRLTVAKAEDLLSKDNNQFTYSSLDVNKTSYPMLFRHISKSRLAKRWDRNNGKPITVEVDSSTSSTRASTKFRYSGKYIQGSQLNPISSFLFSNAGEVPYENGAINALLRTSKTQSQGNVILAISSNETASIYVNERVVLDQNGNDVFSASSDVVGTVRNHKGSYGIRHTDKNSAREFKGNAYWWDENNKAVVRYSVNGDYPISDYGMKSYFQNKTNSAIGFIDPFYNMYLVAFVGDTRSIGFSEIKNKWRSFYHANGQVYARREQKYLILDGTTAYESLNSSHANIKGVQQTPSITLSAAHITSIQPTNIKLKMSSRMIDFAQTNHIKPNSLSITIYNQNGQSTTLVSSNFTIEEDVLYAQVMRDTTSPGGIHEGEFMNGANHAVQITLSDNTVQHSIFSASLAYDISVGHKY